MTIFIINKRRDTLGSEIIIGSFINLGELNNNPTARMPQMTEPNVCQIRSMHRLIIISRTNDPKDK